MIKKTENGLEIRSSWYKEIFLISLVCTIMILVGSIFVFIFQDAKPYTVFWAICLLIAAFLTVIFLLRFIKNVLIINEQGICQRELFKKKKFIDWKNVEEYGFSFYKTHAVKYGGRASLYTLYFSDKTIGKRKDGSKNAKAEATICLLVEKRDIINGFLHKDGQCESVRKYCKRYTELEPYLDKYNWN